MDTLSDTLTPKGLFIFRESYYPKKPNLSKILSYTYIVFALVLIIAYCSPINGLRCSEQTYVAACEADVVTSNQCNNLLIVNCEFNCGKKKGQTIGMTCDYEPCKQGDSCWQAGGQGGGQGPSPPPGPKSCGGNGKCVYGKSGYYIKELESVTGPSTCMNFLATNDKIQNDPSYSVKDDFPGLYPAPLSSCCGILKSHVVCLSPSATIGVVGGYLSILLSIFQVIFILASKFLKEDVLQKKMGHYIVHDPFMSFKKHTAKSIRHDEKIVHHQINHDDIEHDIQMADIYHTNDPKPDIYHTNEPKSV